MKAMFFNIDGTIISPNTERVSDSVKAAIDELHANGVTPILVSGRPPFAIQPVAEELSIHTYIAFNGGLAFHDGEIIYNRPIDKAIIEKMVQMSAQLNHSLVFPGIDGYFTTERNESTWSSIQELFTRVAPLVDPDYWKTHDIYQIELIGKSEQVHHYVEEFQRDLHFYSWHIHKNATNVNPIENSKAIAMTRVLKHLSIDIADSIAIGDGPNDVEMIETANIGIAMGNACESLKRAANYVTATVWDDGAVHALRHFNLIAGN
ncbi:Cof-type HAD-IIB family hydrolase [Alicyclobacillus dauci]|uniref:Cof-type HAD-IIB family hydrolase n=1 Tax=Alicyclobacillus dauci TaxID=1475485 RepID=A0ABY6YZV8_9BACL|nr:Cof-type HAD-IIB family hydrolase [Alicyclobacillus dauci]WAH36165.1 Cof-type HAD-IIB family hydrolase [Alicyclobacillus dauci]